MSKRRQGKPKGGRTARHYEPGRRAQPLPLKLRDPQARDYVADGRAAVEEYFATKHAAEEARKREEKGQ